MQKLKLYINGQWIDQSDHEMKEIVNPATGEIIAYAPRATKEETEEAIQVAAETFESGTWSEISPEERASYLLKISDAILEQQEKLATLESKNNGKTLTEAMYDVADAASCFQYFAGLITQPDGENYETPDGLQGMIVKEPIGVAGLIVPWNFPLLMSAWKIAPALAAGNTIVYKPAEITPLTAYKLFEIIHDVGVPKGVINLLLGRGSVVGQTISESHAVDIVSFTGSTEVGREVMNAATGNLKKVSLELGGKSPNIIFADADFDMAIDYSLYGIYYGAGQVCSAASRILVQETIYEKFLEAFVSRAKQIKVGPGLDETSEMGAIVSEDQLNTILNYIDIGKKEGATLVTGGSRITDHNLEQGFFIEPTVFTDVTSDMRIVQEEIFGPVVTIQPFKDEAEAINLANETDYGLAGAVFSRDSAKAMRVIKKVRAGITWINSYHSTYDGAPWGGYKQSGIGRGLGKYGLEEYQEIKQINMNLTAELSHWFSTED